jgi:integral membrane sensor domain MASE1
MIFNIFVIAIIIGIFLITVVGLLTTELQEKPKSSKFRQWWSNNIIDLDDRYND